MSTELLIAGLIAKYITYFRKIVKLRKQSHSTESICDLFRRIQGLASFKSV